MKVNLRPRFWQRVRKKLLRLSGVPIMEYVGQGVAALAVGFVLAGFHVAGTVLPLPICLAAALGLRPSSFGAYIGGCLGYLVFFPFQAAEPIAAGLLVQAALCIFSEPSGHDGPWFAAGCAAAFMALVGFLFVMEQDFAARFFWRYLLRVAAAAGGAWCFYKAVVEKHNVCRVILLCCLCAGACRMTPVQMPIGAAAACALAAASISSPMALTTAVLCGLALDLTWGPGCATAVLTLGAMMAGIGERPMRLLIWLPIVVLGVLLTGTDPMMAAAATLGGFCSLLVPKAWFGGNLPAVYVSERSRNTGLLLQKLDVSLSKQAQERPDPEMAAVFDQAAERVCRVCGGWSRCWKEQAVQTVEDLEYAAPAMMARGRALRSDLPEGFVERCCHIDGFLTAVNRELDDLSCRRQCRSRIKESRLILAEQYRVLAKAMLAPPVREGTFRYRPEVGFRSEQAQEQSQSGDHGVTFRVGQFFYLILCDGMGVGEEACSEAEGAIEVLRELLQARVDPSDALQMLNGIYILRDDGAFATVDLVQADLMTGQVLLLKWGAAPSYLKWKNHIEKLGTMTMPPGVGIGEDCRPDEIRLSLAKGELLVLLSDGAVCDASTRFLRQYGGTSVKELAGGVIRSQTDTQDDKTAAVLALRPRKTEE